MLRSRSGIVRALVVLHELQPRQDRSEKIATETAPAGAIAATETAPPAEATATTETVAAAEDRAAASGQV